MGMLEDFEPSSAKPSLHLILRNVVKKLRARK
jgi:hypothetical protein